jgi:rubredoxin
MDVKEMEMKCGACGYIESQYINNEGYMDNSQEFIHIKGSFHRECEANYGGSYETRVYLYACPVCGTVRMEK